MSRGELHGDAGRPSPDALLAQAARSGRGRLKIYLGAAPGVGKTYEMLSAARKKRGDGVDVVVGVVETHGRRETEALLEGLPRVPMRRESYRGRELLEMDLDAILARRPQRVLVDELAHSNAPGSRHPKRYLDVEELLAAGIDVYTTLNIQHIESLNGVVEQITQVRVRETVPDQVLDSADEIEVIDLTPEALLERLREGKVYAGAAAERALAHYFTPSNLTALRELALRRTAERVDRQLQQQRRAQGVTEVWAAGEQVLACINESPGAENLVREASRIAQRLNAPWTVLYLETARAQQLGEAARERVARTLRLAESQGAVTLTLPSVQGIAADILAYAREHNCTQIVIAKSRRSRLFELLHGSVVDEIVRGARGITVQVLAGGTLPAGPEDTQGPAPTWGSVRGYLHAFLSVALATLAAYSIDQWLHVQSLALIYLAAIFLTALRHGLRPSLLAAGLALLAHNFFHIEPRYTFAVADPSNALALVFFAAVAVVVSRITASQRTHMLSARQQAETTAELLDFGRRLAGIRKLDELLALTAANIARLLGTEAVLLLPDATRLVQRAAAPAPLVLDDADLAAASWSWEKAQPAGRGSGTLPGAPRLFVPLIAGGRAVAVAGVRALQAEALTPPQRQLLDALCDMAAIAIERIRLAKEVDQAKMLAETEKLRTALLTSVSHDLRTPLASILGSLSALRAYDARFDAAAREELLATAQDETERLSRFVSNLLDMTRLDAGALEPQWQDCDIGDIIASARTRLSAVLARHRVQVVVDDDYPLLRLDPVLIEQVLVNLLDNAAKYAPEQSLIEVRAQRYKYAYTITVMDQGPGIPEDHLPRIFELFYRVQQADRQRAGVGMGLTVCKGFVEALGGMLRASNRPEGGAAFEIRFPPASARGGET